MNRHRFLRSSLIACAAGIALLAAACATNPATGNKDVVLTSQKGEVESSRRAYDEIVKFYGIYEDQAVQDYVSAVGQRIARASDQPDLAWKFTVVY